MVIAYLFTPIIRNLGSPSLRLPTRPSSSAPSNTQMPRPTRRSRSLFLHCTALSDAEYAVYVDALYDVLELEGTGPGHGHGGEGVMVGDEELEGCLVGMREARAWMRGRYKDVSVADIAKVRPVCWDLRSPKQIL